MLEKMLDLIRAKKCWSRRTTSLRLLDFAAPAILKAEMNHWFVRVPSKRSRTRDATASSP